MRILLAPDSFKGTLTALQACEAMERGLRRLWPHAEVRKLPMADGGEGTVQSLVDATGGRFVDAPVRGPLSEARTARYGILADGKHAKSC